MIATIEYGLTQAKVIALRCRFLGQSEPVYDKVWVTSNSAKYKAMKLIEDEFTTCDIIAVHPTILIAGYTRVVVVPRGSKYTMLTRAQCVRRFDALVNRINYLCETAKRKDAIK